MTLPLASVFGALPAGLREPLIVEYNEMMQCFLETRWRASELSGGRFCEIVYTILDGYGKGSYAASPKKPPNFVDACKALEKHGNSPRSFQILIPRMLPPLYEIRNNRNVGHVGGDVDPGLMDANAVVSMASWILAEVVRVLHNISVSDAQKVVDALSTRKIPVVWETEAVKRVLNPKIRVKEQVLLLLAATPGATSAANLQNWTETKDKKYFLKQLRAMHKDRLIEMTADTSSVQLLPPGAIKVESLIAKLRA